MALPENTLTNADGTPYSAGADVDPRDVDPATALLAFAGWLTSRDEVAGPFSLRHEASSMVELVKAFCEAQGWDTDDRLYSRQITLLKKRYPK